MNHNTPAALGAACAVAGLLACPLAILAEDVATGTLDPYVVSATRVKTPRSEVGSAISKISYEQIEAAQIFTVNDVVRLAPGTITAPSGHRGAGSSVFLRGTESNHTQVVIDGIRINDANLLPNSFLGGAFTHNIDALEVLRGPQSALYGGESIGGVLALTTPRPVAGDRLLTWEATAGSFETFNTQLGAQIVDGPASWSLSLGRETTDNARPHNAFEQFFYAGRFDVDLSERLRAGLTARGAHRTFESPGSVFENDLDDVDDDRFSVWTAWLEADLTDTWNSRITYGLVNHQLTSSRPPFIPSTRTVVYKKDTLDWRNAVSWNDQLTSVFGVEWESSSVNDDGYGSINERESLLAAYAQQTVKPIEHLTLNGGGRWEEYDSFGSVWTWRAAGAYEVAPTDTILRASFGTGFRAPSFLELYGFDPPFLPFYAGFRGNPNLQPETSRGWDAGIEQRLFGSASFGVTWFSNDLSDLIDTEFTGVPWTTANAGKAHTQGVEAELHGALQNRLFWQVAYTYLEAENMTTGDRLLRRPEHTLGFDLHTLWLDKRLTLGVGGYAIQNRTDIDAQTFATVDGDDYFVARAYGAYALTDNLALHLRLENALDERYEEIDGYPGRPQGLFGGFRLSF